MAVARRVGVDLRKQRVLDRRKAKRQNLSCNILAPAVFDRAQDEGFGRRPLEHKASLVACLGDVDPGQRDGRVSEVNRNHGIRLQRRKL